MPLVNKVVSSSCRAFSLRCTACLKAVTRVTSLAWEKGRKRSEEMTVAVSGVGVGVWARKWEMSDWWVERGREEEGL